MKPLLFLRKGTSPEQKDKFYLSNGRGGFIRIGSSQLYRTDPTYFNEKETAIAEAKFMGFEVEDLA